MRDSILDYYLSPKNMKNISSTDTLETALPAPPNSAALKLFVVLSRAFNSVNRHAEADAVENGFTLTEWAILEVLYHRGPLLLGDVQRRILVSSGGITYLIDRLERRGLLERRACASDRRARYAALTQAGEQMVRELFPKHVERIEQAMSGLTAAEQRQCSSLLRDLGRNAAALEVSGGES